MTPDRFEERLREAKWKWHGVRMKRRDSPPGSREWSHDSSTLTVAVRWVAASETWNVTFVVKEPASVWIGSGPTASPEVAFRQARGVLRLTTASTRIADERERGGSIEDAQAELDAARGRVTTTTAETQAAERALATLRLEVAQVDAMRAEAQRIEARRADLSAELEAANATAADMRARLDNNRDVIAQAEQIRQAAADADRIGAELETVRAQASEAALEVERAAGRVSEAEAIQRRAAQLEATRVQLEAWLDEWEPKLVEAGERVAELAALGDTAKADVDRFSAEVHRLQDATLVTAEGRIAGLRAGLEAIEDEESEVELRRIASQTLTADDIAETAATEAPARLAEAHSQCSKALARFNDLVAQVAEANAVSSRQPQADETGGPSRRSPEAAVVERILSDIEKLRAQELADRAQRDRLAADHAKARADLDAAQELNHDYDSRLASIRAALNEAGIPEVEPYPETGVDEWERSLRAGGRVIPDAERIARLRAAAVTLPDDTTTPLTLTQRALALESEQRCLMGNWVFWLRGKDIVAKDARGRVFEDTASMAFFDPRETVTLCPEPAPEPRRLTFAEACRAVLADGARFAFEEYTMERMESEADEPWVAVRRNGGGVWAPNLAMLAAEWWVAQ